MSLGDIFMITGHVLTGFGFGLLAPALFGLVFVLSILGLLIVPAVLAMAWFVHGLLREAALWVWRTFLPRSFKKAVSRKTEDQRVLIGVGLGLGVVTQIGVAM